MALYKPSITLATARVAVLLLMALLFTGACTGDQEDGAGGETDAPTRQTGDTTPSPDGGPETTGDMTPPEVTLGEGPDPRPEVVVRLEGDPKTTFTGLCSVGQEQNVLSGRVPKRFTFNLSGRQLECRIEKRDEGDGDLKVVLVAGNSTRSVQQTNSPGGSIKLSYESE